MPGDVKTIAAPSVERWRAARLPALPGEIISGMRCRPLATSSWLSVKITRSRGVRVVLARDGALDRRHRARAVAGGEDGAVDVVHEAVPLRVEAAAAVLGLREMLASLCQSSAIWMVRGNCACAASFIERSRVQPSPMPPWMLMVESQRMPSQRYSESHMSVLSRMYDCTSGRPKSGRGPQARVGELVRVEVDALLAEAVAVPAVQERGVVVVVHHVEDDADAARVRGVDERAEVVGRAVRALGGERAGGVVAPAARAGELGDRHQLDHVHAERDEGVEPVDRALVGAVRLAGAHVEGAEVQLVDDLMVEVGRRRTARSSTRRRWGRRARCCRWRRRGRARADRSASAVWPPCDTR